MSCVRINCERETPVRSFYFSDQTGAGWFITDTTQAVKAQTNRENMMSWPEGQWIKYGDANGENPMAQRERQPFVSSSLRLALMETNQPYQKFPQPVQTEIFGVCSLYIRSLIWWSWWWQVSSHNLNNLCTVDMKSGDIKNHCCDMFTGALKEGVLDGTHPAIYLQHCIRGSGSLSY